LRFGPSPSSSLKQRNIQKLVSCLAFVLSRF
jgi:hypothetical protein